MAIEDNWTYKDVQELKLCQRKDENCLRNYKVYTFVDGEECEVFHVRKSRFVGCLRVIRAHAGLELAGKVIVFLPLDTKFHVRKEE